jgi:thiol-disulfide isomerase/thioredoxin
MKRRNLLFGAFTAPLTSLSSRFLHARDLKHPDGTELVGSLAPPLEIKQWLHSQPMEVSDLRGKVVLLRWWTQGCPFCTATAPALHKLDAEYGARGLQIIAVYHPKPPAKPPAKPPGSVDMAVVERDAAKKVFTYPIAIDTDWSALKRWWLGQERDYTSVSFLVDRQGIIRYVHPGGEFHEGTQGGHATHESCNRDFRAIEAEIERLLG